MSRKSLSQQSAELARRLEAIPEEILGELRPALIKSAEDLAERMRALVLVEGPRGPVGADRARAAHEIPHRNDRRR